MNEQKVSEERLEELRKQYSYRAYGQSREENDQRAQECSDIAAVCNELLTLRQSASGEIEALEEAACDVENMAINEYGVNPTLLKHVRRVEYAKKQAATLRHMAARMK